MCSTMDFRSRAWLFYEEITLFGSYLALNSGFEVAE